MAAKQYASKTTVAPEKSQTEVRAMLKALGAGRLAVFSEPKGASVAFEVRGTFYKITAPRARFVAGVSRAIFAQSERSAWRDLVLIVKAKKVAIDQRTTTLEREFFSDVVSLEGSIPISHSEALIRLNYREGPPQDPVSES